jgi:tetratricopeptide (TPR) repeat protein
MQDYNDFDDEDFEDFEDSTEESYPDYFYAWDDALSKKQNPPYMDADDIGEIIEIYLSETEIDKAKQTIQQGLKWHPDNKDLVYDILAYLNDFELWNDLLSLSEQYKDFPELWSDGHRLTALLHLGMEEDAFLFFQKMKRKYEKSADELSIMYQAMAEALLEMDLYDASVGVMDEAIEVLGVHVDFYWLQLQAYVSVESKEKVLEIAGKIEQINPLDGETWYRLGSVYIEMEEPEKAIDAFEFAESLGYTRQSNYLGMVTAYEKNGNPLKALEKLKEYLALYPENYMAYILAANICADMKMWESAIKYVDDALKLVPDFDSLYLYKSNFFINLGERKKAMSTLEEGIRQTDDKQGDLKKELEKLQSESLK